MDEFLSVNVGGDGEICAPHWAKETYKQVGTFQEHESDGNHTKDKKMTGESFYNIMKVVKGMFKANTKRLVEI